MNLTAAQTEAIAARGNVVVVAGAGTGKTRTLVERCLSCLLEEKPRASIDELLVVTFTEAAAAEVRQRIRARLVEEREREPNAPHWPEQLALFETAQIGTLHSFCLQLVRRHFYQLRLDPQLSVLAEEEARLLAEETLDDLLQKHYEGTGKAARAVQELIQVQGRGVDRVIRRLLLRVHAYKQTLPDPAGWLRAQRTAFASPAPAQWDAWLEEALAQWRERSLPFLEGKAAENPVASQCAEALREMAPGKSRAAQAAILQGVLAAQQEYPEGKKGLWVDPLGRFFDEAAFLFSLVDPQTKPNPLAQDWDWVRNAMTTLLDLAGEFASAFTETKRELGVLDFHDLEQYALQLLWDFEQTRPTPIAQSWRNQFRFVFVDEYQDINAAQDKILSSLSREGPQANRFLVGDLKQSIYRFRLANPAIFQAYLQRWQPPSGNVVVLSDNFRSREGILHFVNSFFEACMRRELGGADYDERARLRFGSEAKPELSTGDSASLPNKASTPAATPNDGPVVELHLRLKKRSPSQPETEEQSSEAEAEVEELAESAKEARLITLRLRALKAARHPVWDEQLKAFRPVDWRDMAILLRSPANKTQNYAVEFGRLNLPLEVARRGFYESLEISDLVSLLQLLDNPLQDLPLLAVLHSPLVGLTAAELATIRLAARGARFWTALLRWRDGAQVQSSRSKVQGPEAQVEKVSLFLERYGRWRQLARQSSLSRCLETILAETHYTTWLLTQPHGSQRVANVQRLLALAEKFDQFQRQGLFRFLNLIEAQRHAEAEPEVTATGEQNAVRLMSIHQSKGLEFPVVVVADLGKPFNLSDLRTDIILDEVYGLCPQIKPPHTGKRYPSLPYWLARQRQTSETLGEELRLLYVAMTRARDLLILSGTIWEKSFNERWLQPGERPEKPAPVKAVTESQAKPAKAGTTNESGRDTLQDARIPIARVLAARNYADWLGLWFAEHVRAGSGETEGRNALLRWVVHEDAELAGRAEEPAPHSMDAQHRMKPEEFQGLKSRLAWRYPFAALSSHPAKSSVSALRRQARAADEEAARMFGDGKQNFLRGTSIGKPRKPEGKPELSAVEIGNAHHTFLQRVTLHRTGSVGELQAEAQRLEGSGDLSAEEVASLNFEHLAGFWKSEPGRGIREQGTAVRRELPFTARFSPNELARIMAQTLDAAFEGEFVVVQGVVDLAVILPREIWLLDFKTDDLKPKELASRAEAYAPQVRIYAAALSRIYRRPVSKCWLYFLSCQEPVAVAMT